MDGCAPQTPERGRGCVRQSLDANILLPLSTRSACVPSPSPAIGELNPELETSKGNSHYVL